MKPPYTFDGPYAGCYANAPMCADQRHVYVLHDILCAWPFQSALELGCYDGASTTAFVEAFKKRPFNITLCDTNPRANLLEIWQHVQGGNGKNVTISSAFSWDVLARSDEFDFIFVDANHDIGSVSRELVHLVRRKPLCVMAHDTNGTAAGYPDLEGAAHLAQVFRAMRGYRCIEDCEKREGEETDRGLFFATTDPALHSVAAGIFDKWCSPAEALV